jgi:hypothetical protein
MVAPLSRDPTDPNAIARNRGSSHVVHSKEQSWPTTGTWAIHTNVVNHENTVGITKKPAD